MRFVRSMVLMLSLALYVITLSQSAQAWEGAVTIDQFVMHESSAAQGEQIPATVTVTNHDIESHSIHFRGLLVDSNGDYVRGDDGSAHLVHVYLPGQLYHIWSDETKTLEIEIKTYNLPVGTWTADIGVLLFDDDDEVTDYVTTLQFEITEPLSSEDMEFSALGGLLCCFVLIITIPIVRFGMKKQQELAITNPQAAMAVQTPTVVPAGEAQPPSVPFMPQQVIAQPPIPIPYTSLPPGGQYKQVDSVNIYTVPDGRTWIQQQDGNFVQN